MGRFSRTDDDIRLAQAQVTVSWPRTASPLTIRPEPARGEGVRVGADVRCAVVIGLNLPRQCWLWRTRNLKILHLL
jgi:hypothetical protein